ncbi:MAG: ATP-binding cassette domain-containing protein [Candidatus Glassbacteria bacterium]|nr:ATP-binding cassette domain-containing protein [Candidatus Glassbacteria bacterium]
MQVLKAENICHDFGVRPLFEGLELVLEEGDRLGLIGANGSGKTTLLRILAGLENPLAGTVVYPLPVKTGYLAQEPEFPRGLTVYRALEQALDELVRLREEYEDLTARLKGRLERAERAELGRREQKLHDLLDTRSGWDLRPRVEEMITRLRLPGPETPLESLSGGIIKRVALGKVLLAEPQLLLLDEPTNHLDTGTVAWLEKKLAAFRGTLVLVAHDRYFLEAVVTRIAEVEHGGLRFYPGSYTAYLEAKKAEWELTRRSDEKRRKLLAREVEWLRRSVKARTHKQKARIQRIAGMAAVKDTRPAKPVKLLFDPDTRHGRTILKAHRICKSYASDCPLIADYSLELLGGERIGIIGPNGCGKTTLLRMLVGELEPDSGYVREGANTVIAYFDQQRGQLDPQATVWDSVAPGGDHVLVSSRKLHKRAFLESFLFPAAVHRFRVGLLSGGERNRLLLARLMLSGANVLILDEPTNDLDLPTLQVLEERLGEFRGSLIVVTHDRYFLDRVVEEIYGFEDGGAIRHYPGNYSFYLQCLEREKQARKADREGLAKQAARNGAAAEKKPQALHYLEKKELETIEDRIAGAEAGLARLRQRLEDPALATDSGALGEMFEQARISQQEVDRLYERWDYLEKKRQGGLEEKIRQPE